MEERILYNLGDLVEVRGGKRLPKGETLITTKTSHPYIRIRDLGSTRIINLNSSYEYLSDNIFQHISRYIVNEGDVLLSIVGTIGLTGIVGSSLDKANLTENCVKLVCSNRIDSRFLYYFLSSSIGQAEIAKGTVGAVQPKLPIKNIQDIQIKLPSLKIQRRISNLLSSLDDKIELNNRINHNLEQQAQALYKSWFVDFEPFKGGKFVDSELGLIPEGWRVGTLSDVSSIIMGQSPSGASFNTNGNGVVFFQGRTDFGDRYPSARLYTTEPTRYAERYSVLLSVRAPVGDINIAKEKCCIGRGIAAIFGAYQSFVYYTVNSLKTTLNRYNGEGTVFGSINKKDLESLTILVPPTCLQESYNTLVKNLDDEMFRRSLECESLMRMRDMLLPKLMSGELSINNLH